ncbi:hypothetical protein CURTO8I2_290017 [Curtobacterium sp. 8I-2]|nr:hypothetical protein CURTO8I2_290017 [Curtobacterium sp. 8I-2]
MGPCDGRPPRRAGGRTARRGPRDLTRRRRVRWTPPIRRDAAQPGGVSRIWRRLGESTACHDLDVTT